MSRALNLARAGIGLTGDASGNVGLGISPGFRFDLKMSSASRAGGLAIRRSSNDNHQIGLWTDGGAMYFDAVTDNAAAAGVTVFRRSLDSGANFSESARIDSTGNFLVGVTAPKNSGGYDSNRTFLTIAAKTGGADRGAFLELVGTGGGSPNYWLGRVDFCSSGNPKSHAAIYSFTDSGGSNSGALIFGTNASANTIEPTERARISSAGYFGIGVTNPSTQLHVSGITNLGNVIHGSPTNTNNDNSSCVILHKLGQSQGYQFSGTIAANSWTGNAMVIVNIIVDYTNDSVSYQVLAASTLNPATATKTTLQLVKITYGGSSYLGVRKNGGGTGTIMLSGCGQGNTPYPYEVSSYTVSSTIATLN